MAVGVIRGIEEGKSRGPGGGTADVLSVIACMGVQRQKTAGRGLDVCSALRGSEMSAEAHRGGGPLREREERVGVPEEKERAGIQYPVFSLPFFQPATP